MFCKKCGKQIPDNSNACQYCGAMLTQRPVNNTYNQVNANYQPQPKQPKKTPGKIIVPIVAVVVVLAIIISVVSCVNIKKNEDKKRLLEVLEASTDKPVVEFIHEDYDGDGTTEAYAVVGESEKKEDYTEYHDADIYFVNQTEAEIIKESVSGHSNGTIEVDDTIYVSLEVYDEGTDKGISFIYTAEENKPVESDISGKYSDVHQDSGKIFATDEDGNEIEIEITDSKSDSEETTVEKVAEEKSTKENITENQTAQNFNISVYETVLSQYRDVIEKGFKNVDIDDAGEYVAKSLFWMYPKEDELYYALYDIDKNGVKELFICWKSSSIQKDIICGMFTYNGGKIYNTGDEVGKEVIGYKVTLIPRKDGSFFTVSNTGLGSGAMSFYSYSSNGYTLKDEMGVYYWDAYDASTNRSNFEFFKTVDEKEKEITQSEFNEICMQNAGVNFDTFWKASTDIDFNWIKINPGESL